MVDLGEAEVLERQRRKSVEEPHLGRLAADTEPSRTPSRSTPRSHRSDYVLMPCVSLTLPSVNYNRYFFIAVESASDDDARRTLIFASSFFVLVILAVYGFHRYNLVYLYVKHQDEVPTRGKFDDAAARHRPAAAVQRETSPSGSSTPSRHRLPARQARDPGARRLDRRDRRHRRSWPSAATPPRASTSSTSTAPTAGLQGRRARGGLSVASGEFIAIFDADFVPRHDILPRPSTTSPTTRSAWCRCAGTTSTATPRCSPDPGDLPRRPLRHRAQRPQPLRPVHPLQRHGRRLAPRHHRRRRRLAARHADRGPRPLLPRPDQGLAVRLPARARRPGRAAAGDDRLQAQQHRWAKGTMQTGLKLLPRILRSHQPLRSRPRRSSI